jgi:hypothetical protein
VFEINFEYDGSLDNLEEEIKQAIAAKLVSLTDMLYSKVMDNVSGKILQKQTGQLAGSIRQEIVDGSDTMTGTVFVEPATMKAWALERGGEEAYTIVPTKGQYLSWIGKDGIRVFAKQVLHPPSKEFAYLREALGEMEQLVPEGFREALEQVLRR